MRDRPGQPEPARAMQEKDGRQLGNNGLARMADELENSFQTIETKWRKDCEQNDGEVRS